MATAIVLCSGGQDSLLVIKLLQKAGIKIIAINFISYFFGGPSKKLDLLAKELDIPVVFVPFQQAQLQITIDPKFGRGKNFNACIDCHALMIKYAGSLLKQYNADFIATGEVLNQRPMSQNMASLKKVANESGFGNLLVRPLSGQLLEITEAETLGFIKREDMRSIQGRSQTGQTTLAAELGMSYMMSGHGGGCLLTDQNFGRKMKTVETDGFLKATSFLPYILQHSRFLRIDKGKYAFVGRNHEENQLFTPLHKFGTIFIADAITPGPRILLVEMNETELIYTPVQQDIEDVELESGKCQSCNSQQDFNIEWLSGSYEASQQLQIIGKEIYSIFSKHKGTKGGQVLINGILSDFESVTIERKAELTNLMIQ
ncbi:TRNA (5-methylaminomethyl-2-thiouridylate)-methyltransferase [Spironucleus salmonicida]|uniref:tRNA (5-methylaminomethyl-2-thiouridylate)-methyltransferase n=1 Tax=Spironucleus salmonicida TaxID=348837 RepID=V6LIW3_9EUKA|nr:TRNA (5-methylaminomethyl-2-thiouridylate)-methyltransferase [Spironucleus salmonicida]|eukprot:EST44502.1 tRNA (5-methylaminomethyl-2-thiouridylate)-methyltransferase [Spironucleus salmonicida]